MKNPSVRRLAVSAVIAAVYAALTMSTGFMSYGSVQFRIAEALGVLPFFFPVTTWGVFVGCLIANLLSPIGAADLVVGSLTTLAACLCVTALGRTTVPGERPGWGRCVLTCLCRWCSTPWWSARCSRGTGWRRLIPRRSGCCFWATPRPSASARRS